MHAYMQSLGILSLLKKEVLLDGFLCWKFCCRHKSNVVMHSSCLLTSMELILIPSCSLLYLHFNDMKCSKYFIIGKKVITINIILIQKK